MAQSAYFPIKTPTENLLNGLIHRERMTEDRTKLPCLDEKGIDGKRSYNYQQWLDRFKQYTKRKEEIDVGPLIRDETMTETIRKT